MIPFYRWERQTGSSVQQVTPVRWCLAFQPGEYHLAIKATSLEQATSLRTHAILFPTGRACTGSHHEKLHKQPTVIGPRPDPHLTPVISEFSQCG